MKKTLGIIVATIVVEVIIFVIFIETGLYNVSALKPDPGLMQWIFSTTSDNSMEHHAKGISAPTLTDSSMIAEGFDHYNEMCVTCHGAPGVDKSEAGEGLYPQAPNLAESAKELPSNELFWVIKNGIKSTGMPAFAKTHSDQKIWAMVAFLEKMKNMTPQEYAAMQKFAVNEEDKSDTMNMNMKNTHMKMPAHDH